MAAVPSKFQAGSLRIAVSMPCPVCPKSFPHPCTCTPRAPIARRYCELQMHDRNKIPAFTKLPWILVRGPSHIPIPVASIL